MEAASWHERVEDLLGAVDVLAGVGQPVGLHLGLRALALDLADAVGLLEPEAALADRVLVPVERANGWARGAVALLVVGASVARAAETRHLRRPELDRPRGRLDLLCFSRRSLRLRRATQVHAAVRDDGEARDAVGHAVVTHEGRPLAHHSLSLLGKELRDEELILREVVQRAEVDRVVLLTD